MTKMRKIKWTKVYRVVFGDTIFKVYVSEHTDGSFYSSVLHWKRVGNWIEPSLQTFIEATEARALGRCERWLKANVKEKYEITHERTEGQPD